MTWRSETTPADRILACLPYLMPLIESFRFGQSLFQDFPILITPFLPLLPVIRFYYQFSFLGLILFFALFFLVVRNPRIPHFIRFNTMQAILLSILISVVSIINDMVLAQIPGFGFVVTTINSTLFLATVVAFIFSLVQSLRGHYAEIPPLSDAVYMQVR
jgi:uncharacterized membrane protein